MYFQTIRSFSFPRTCLAIFVLMFNTNIVEAQAVDIADAARASRDKLAAEIGAVDGIALRVKLQKSADNDRLAHWYAGEVMIDDQWRTLVEAQQQASSDKQLTAYRALRAKSADRLVDHVRLARWCKKRDLDDLAKMHWLHVLQFDRSHRAALSELNLTWYQGTLLTHDEAKSYQDREREWLKQKKSWQAKVKQLRRAVEKGLVKEEMAAREELREIREPAAIPALLEEFTEPAKDEVKTIARRTELMAVLGGIDAPAAVETLAQFAVESENKSVRYAAMDQLKAKPLETFVPALLAGMAQPIEASVSFNEVGNRIVSSYSYSQEGPGNKVYESQESSYRVVPGKKYNRVTIFKHRYQPGTRKYIPGRTIPASRCSNGNLIPARTTPGRYKDIAGRDIYTPIANRYLDNAAYSGNKSRTIASSRAQASQLGNRIVERNVAIRHQNERIASVLTEVTGETLAAFPKSWWNWWSDYLAQHPDVATAGTRQQLNRALMNQEPRGLARGTWVWTRQGKQSVEDILPGDYVLAQDPRTGELAYKVVLAIATPREMAVSLVSLTGSELHCAPGHVVWTAGTGWRRVSKLTTGQSLHGATAVTQVEQVDDAFRIPSFDLIVDDFHTFFVGEQGVLVHDATPIAATHVALPGFSPAAVADAVKLAGNAR